MSRWRLGAAVTFTAASTGAWYYTDQRIKRKLADRPPKSPSRNAQMFDAKHRPFGENEYSHMRKMGGHHVDPSENPGIRVEPMWVDPHGSFAKQLIKEVKMCMGEYGRSHLDEANREMFEKQQESVFQNRECTPNMQRVTGRYERDDQVIAPWGYGLTFDSTKLPPGIHKLLCMIQESPSFDLGDPRDLTLNYRKNSYFRLDPHVDPLGDGDNVFILGLNSDTVLTVTLREEYEKVVEGKTGRTEFLDAVYESWTDHDIDILIENGTLVHMYGDGRYSWTHGTRLGVEAAVEKQDFISKLFGSNLRWVVADWFGTRDNIVPRTDERYSIVFAFAGKKPTEQTSVGA